MKKQAFFLLFLVILTVLHCTQPAVTASKDDDVDCSKIIYEPISRTFDRLIIYYHPKKCGYYVDVVLEVSGKLVDIKTLYQKDDVFNLDILIGNYQIKGILIAEFHYPGIVSLLRGDFTFHDVSQDINEYKGAIGWWYTK